MAEPRTEWIKFGWQGVNLKVPEDWNLGRVDGNYASGYARLDDAEIVRAEVEWREEKLRGKAVARIGDLVDRYIGNLAKKAEKTDTSFSVERRAKFLKDERWLEGSNYETFTWEADYRAYNLARICPHCGRIVLLRILTRLQEDLGDVIETVFSSLEDHPRDGQVIWSIYGLSFLMPADYKLSEHELKSGHIQLSFEKGKQVCRVQRLSLARMLLKDTTLKGWYPTFCKKQLRDLVFEAFEEEVHGHEGLRVAGRPRSRWRQLLRPLPLINPRPRQYLDNRVWHCHVSDKICIVDCLSRKKGEAGDLIRRVTDGYICHQEQAEAEPRDHAEFAAGAQRSTGLEEE